MTDEETFEAALDDLMDRLWPAVGQLNKDAKLLQELASLRLVYADWLEERGDGLAGAQRWMAAQVKFPRLGHELGHDTWDWWRIDRPDPEDLPGEIWDHLPGERNERYECKEYATRRLAERALFKSLKLLDKLN
jgi:uncharacterized protein (TIGR02996 family)